MAAIAPAAVTSVVLLVAGTYLADVALDGEDEPASGLVLFTALAILWILSTAAFSRRLARPRRSRL